jgi:hypothetical protein
MRAVKHRPARPGNPGASLYCRRPPRWPGAANVAECATALLAQHVEVDRAGCSGSTWPSAAVARCDSRSSTPGCNTAGRGRSVNTTAPGRDTARTGTDERRAPCPSSATSQRCWTDSSQGATLLQHHLYRHGVGRGAVSKLACISDRCRARLLRHRRPCTAHTRARHRRREQQPPKGQRRRPASGPAHGHRLRLPGRPRAARQANLMRARSPSTSQSSEHYRTQRRCLAGV